MTSCGCWNLADEDYNHKRVRDPIHGLIGLSLEECRIIGTAVFLRLYLVKQLSHTYLVYPSAVHTRFEHSIGAMHVASRMCDALGISGEDKRIVRLAALLHDVGHGPFSHLFEQVLQKSNPGMQNIHETISGMLITQDPELVGILGDSAQLVNSIIQGDGINDDRHSLMHSIVSGNLDADKLDYLRRDSYHLGVKYGEYDLERIIHTLDRTVGSLPVTCVTSKGAYALENYRLSRSMMHAQVYEHHARLAVERMFLSAMEHAVREGVFPKDSFVVESDGFLDYYLTLNDASIYEIILNSKNAVLSKEILTYIRKRRLLKRASEFMIEHITNPTIRKDLSMKNPPLETYSEKIATAAGLDLPPHMIIFHKSAIQVKLYGPGDLMYTHNGENHELSAHSPISSSNEIMRLYVFGPGDVEQRKRINAAVAKTLEFDPKYSAVV